MVHAYEPCQRNSRFLIRNIAENNIGNCAIHTEGLYSEACRGTMKQHAGGNSGCYYFEKSDTGDISCIPLDSHAHSEVDFIKLDTEGSELHVLKGAEQTLRTWKPLVQIECNSLSETLFGIQSKETIMYLKSLGYVEFDTSDHLNIFLYCPELPSRIVCFWTGTNPMNQVRQECLERLRENAGVDVTLVTPENLETFILQAHPLHPAYQYLSETHKADYLRTYFMHFYGGGYSDIKKAESSWAPHFGQLRNSHAWICGYPEIEGGVAYPPNKDHWSDLIGNGAYICKPQTPMTTEWYTRMLALMDSKLEALMHHPATYPGDCAENGTGYPIEWNEMLGRIFHDISFKYLTRLLRTLPTPDMYNYK